MMSINKMLIGGAAVFATVSLIGCKDDDSSDSCDGVDIDFTKTPAEVATAYAAFDTDCVTCLTDDGYTGAGYGALDKALQACGGSVKASDACKGVTVTAGTDIDGACGVCIFAWDPTLTVPVSSTASGAEAAYKGCGGDQTWPAAE